VRWMDGEGSSYLRAGVGEVLGLLEILDDESGKMDVYRLGKSIHHHLEQLLDVLETARILGFIEYEAGDVFLTPKGKRFVESTQDERKRMIADALLEIPVFRDFLSFLSSREDHTVELDELDQFIVGDFTHEELQKIKNAFLNWGRFAELIWVDSDEREIHLEEEEEEA
jgi:NitT/TauT family transport system ATP-binding protein